MEYTDYSNEDNDMKVVSVGKLEKKFQNLNSHPGPSIPYAWKSMDPDGYCFFNK